MKVRWLFPWASAAVLIGAVPACGDEPDSVFGYPEAGAEAGAEASIFEPGKSDAGRGCGAG